MSETKSFASLSPSLLARKGAARPAMRPQLQPLHQFHEATARQMDEDLGWNDMGDEHPVLDQSREAGGEGAEIVPLKGSEHGADERPEVLRQRDGFASRISDPKPRRSALAEGRRAAFTLRMDADRHLRLRLASTVLGQSAQQVVTEALDRYLAEMPEVSALADRVRKRR